MGLFSKLRETKEKRRASKEQKAKAKHERLHSQDAERPQHDVHKRGKAQLILGDAPNRPRFGGKGLQGDTTYDIERAPHSKSARKSKPAGEFPLVEGVYAFSAYESDLSCCDYTREACLALASWRPHIPACCTTFYWSVFEYGVHWQISVHLKVSESCCYTWLPIEAAADSPTGSHFQA